MLLNRLTAPLLVACNLKNVPSSLSDMVAEPQLAAVLE